MRSDIDQTGDLKSAAEIPKVVRKLLHAGFLPRLFKTRVGERPSTNLIRQTLDRSSFR